jgi:hypothetical protein
LSRGKSLLGIFCFFFHELQLGYDCRCHLLCLCPSRVSHTTVDWTDGGDAFYCRHPNYRLTHCRHWLPKPNAMYIGSLQVPPWWDQYYKYAYVQVGSLICGQCRHFGCR